MASMLLSVNSSSMKRFLSRRLSHLQMSWTPPVAKKVPTKVYFGVDPTKPGEYRGELPMNPPKIRVDSYFWLRDESREDEEVLEYIREENTYTENVTSGLRHLRDDLYAEMLSHLQETDQEVPARYAAFMYYSKTVKGLSYPIHCRSPLHTEEEQVILDENLVAEGHEYSDVVGHGPCPSHRYLAYAVDHNGGETYSLRIKDLETDSLLEDVIEEISGDFAWGADSSTLFYLKMDEEHRPNRLYMHTLGSSEDTLLLVEDDSRFWMGIDKSASERFLFVGVESKETSEVRFIDLQGVVGSEAHRFAANRIKVIQPRVFGLRYEVEHHEDSFLIVTNENGAKNNKLVSCPVSDCDTSNWKDVLPYDAKIQIDEVLPFKNYFAIFGRENGLQVGWIAKSSTPAQWRKIPIQEEAYSIWIDTNFEFNSEVIRLGFSSFLTPSQIIDYNMNSGEWKVLKQKDVPNYDPTAYRSKRIKATASDGTQIPMSLVYHKSAAADGTPRPLLLYGYGSYGMSIEPTFDYKRLALLDRGIVFAIAHIRGGGEMGRAWYEDEGKYLKKMNTFTDFADCASHLCRLKYTSPNQLAILGRSAGGLLIGAVVNMFPGLCKCAVADVPFVDVLNSMSDPSIPLTVTEWEEWGNPNEMKYYEYMASYSPYDNVREQKYPAMLVTAGLNDPRVAYWEASKWVAKLREFKTDSNPLLLKTDMTSGHFSASDRYKLLKEAAFEYAFIVDQIIGVE